MTSSIREPKVNANIISAQQSATILAQRVLFVGQMLSGSATAGSLVENIGVSGEENDLFGKKSHIAGMIREARKLNKITRFDAIPLADNGSGVAATSTIVFTGTATATGTLTFYVGSKRNYAYDVAVASGATAASLATALVALINADTAVPVTSSVSTATVTITASNKGTTGNAIGLAMVGTVAGIGVTVNAMSSGATDPSLTTVFDPVASARYQTIVWPSKYSKTTLTDFLDARFNIDNNVLDGEGITCNTDTYSNIITALDALNSKALVYIANKKVSATYYKGSAIFELDDAIASQFAAIRSLRFSSGADISRYVEGGDGARDDFGGIHIASLPYHNTPLPNLPVIASGNGFITSEMEAIIEDGGAMIGNNDANNTVICGRITTTYKTDSAGNQDDTFKYLEYVDTASAIREYYYVNLRKNFAQSRLTDGDLVPDFKMANAETISAVCDKFYSEMAAQALTPSGEKMLKYFKQNKTVTTTMITGTAIIIMIMPIVTQLRTIYVTMQLAFVDFS
jgi:phage tail sheath gpL-like